MQLTYGARLKRGITTAHLHDAHVEGEDQDIVYSKVDYISCGCRVHLRQNDPLTTQKLPLKKFIFIKINTHQLLFLHSIGTSSNSIEELYQILKLDLQLDRETIPDSESIRPSTRGTIPDSKDMRPPTQSRNYN